MAVVVCCCRLLLSFVVVVCCRCLLLFVVVVVLSMESRHRSSVPSLVGIDLNVRDRRSSKTSLCLELRRSVVWFRFRDGGGHVHFLGSIERVSKIPSGPSGSSQIRDLH